MAMYDVFVFCNECGKVHPMGIGIGLDLGPEERQSVGEFYSGKALPPEVANLVNNWTRCPETGKMFRQKDNNQVFLVYRE